MEQYKFPNDPVANPSSVIQGPDYRFTLINDFVIRFEWSEDGVFEDRPSTFAINRRFPTPEHQVHQTDGSLEIRTKNVHLAYDKKRFSTNGLTASFTSKTTKWGAEWRFGEESSANLGGTARTLDGVDGRCDVGMGILAKDGYAALDDSASMLFEKDGFVAPRRPGDRVDGYLFGYGYDFKGAMKAFYAISGHQPLIPRWALGNWWSRYYAYSDKEYLTLMDDFQKKGIPMSVAVIDMDWHWVAGDHVPHAGWTGYSWNKDLFPDPKAFADQLHERNLKISLNDHPHSGVHHHEDIYEELAAALDHDTSRKAPILFDPTSTKFMRAYFNILHRRLEQDGCDFWWIDWQQGPHSKVPGLDPLWLLNHFHYLDHEQQKLSSNPIIFSRYAGPGSHRYPVGFSGDTIVTWESLQFQPEFTATASNIGYGWWSHDIGGHMGGYADDELSTRWVQLGVFSPLMRLHSTTSRWRSKEPWRYRKEHEEVMTSFLRLRHKLVPYLHSMNLKAATDDEPLVQPLYWRFPSRNEAYEFPNEYFFGSEMVVAPIVHPRDPRTGRASVRAWVPPGRHIDIYAGIVYDGDRRLQMYRPLENIPVLAPEGSIIPLDPGDTLMNGCPNTERIEVVVVVGENGNFTLYEDGVDDLTSSEHLGEPRLPRKIELDFKASGMLEVGPSNKAWTFSFVGANIARKDCEVFVNGESAMQQDYVQILSDKHALNDLGRLVVELPVIRGQRVTVKLGDSPQLGTVDVAKRTEQLLSEYQMDFSLKDKILAIVESKHSAAVKIAELLALDIDEAFVGPIQELLSAVSR